MASWQNGKITNQELDEIAHWQNNKVTKRPMEKWQVD
jgi:hypothetical protein